MTIEVIRSALGWCAVINSALLLFWWLMFVFARNWVFKIHSRWFDLTPAAFNGIHYGGMGLYKLGMWMFNLTPYLVLRFLV
jgi:hypothetical protein